uniref:Uncharacterized protein n=1 Tax=Candidatus Kentrum sp. FW TaxID=2126338 RepID=A0A450TSR6_9GAMM|nr:MAG: hypothetical protein BECKFW1821C_GA0114237_102726 [Candidatus Kentron sp. FW]
MAKTIIENLIFLQQPSEIKSGLIKQVYSTKKRKHELKRSYAENIVNKKHFAIDPEYQYFSVMIWPFFIAFAFAMRITKVGVEMFLIKK